MQASRFARPESVKETPRRFVNYMLKVLLGAAGDQDSEETRQVAALAFWKIRSFSLMGKVHSTAKLWREARRGTPPSVAGATGFIAGKLISAARDGDYMGFISILFAHRSNKTSNSAQRIPKCTHGIGQRVSNSIRSRRRAGRVEKWISRVSQETDLI